MDRNLVYPGSIPLDTDLLTINRNTMIGLGFLAQAVLGTSTIVDGLACSPTSPPSLTVTVGPGSITQLSVVDTSAYGSLPADTTDPLVKMGINIAPVTFTLTAPSTSGQSVNYLIEAAFSEADANPVVLPYYNAANPAQAFSGPSNSGSAQNTQRNQRVQLQIKSGAPANTGSQATPPADSGWVGLYQITVNYGQTAVTGSSIVTLVTAPFLNWKLPNLSPGFGAGVQTFGTPGNFTFTVPAGVSQLEVEIWGAGSGSYASTSAAASGGGSGGGYARKRITNVKPGQIYGIAVGQGGAGGTTAGAAPQPGAESNFSLSGVKIFGATGGSLNGSATTANPQNGAIPGGQGYNGDVNLQGSSGQIAFQGVGGMGGGAPMGGMQTSGTVGNSGVFPGGGASGAGTGSNGATPYNGGSGANGYVVIRW